MLCLTLSSKIAFREQHVLLYHSTTLKICLRIGILAESTNFDFLIYQYVIGDKLHLFHSVQTEQSGIPHICTIPKRMMEVVSISKQEFVAMESKVHPIIRTLTDCKQRKMPWYLLYFNIDLLSWFVELYLLFPLLVYLQAALWGGIHE